MRIKVLELCSYGQTGDYEAIDFDGSELDLDFIPDGWQPKGGNDEARKLQKDDWIIEVYVEGRIIAFDVPSINGKDITRELLENWPKLS